MKWIKLFEQYTHDNKIAACNLVFKMFQVSSRFDEIGLKKLKTSDETFYYYLESQYNIPRSIRYKKEFGFKAVAGKIPVVLIYIDSKGNIFRRSLRDAPFNLDFSDPVPISWSSLSTSVRTNADYLTDALLILLTGTKDNFFSGTLTKLPNKDSKRNVIVSYYLGHVDDDKLNIKKFSELFNQKATSTKWNAK